MYDISGILSVIPIVKTLIELLNKKLLKYELAKSIRNPLNEAVEAYERFYEAFSTALGMVIFSNVVEPPNPEKVAEKISNQIEREFIAVKKSLIRLMKVVSAHQDEFKRVFPRDKVLLLEITLKAFESEEPDWKLIMEHPKFNERLNKELKREKKFVKLLNKKLDEMYDRNNLEDPFVDDIQAILDMFSDNNFRKKFMQLVFEELNKQMKKRNR